MKEKYQLIYELEYELLKPEVRKSINRLQELLAKEFIEHGSSGRIYTKEAIIKALITEESFDFHIENFAVQALSPEVMLATYQITIASKTSLRASIWQFKNSRWQMIFHQGTVCQEESL